VNFEKDYMNLVDHVLATGEHRETRAGPTTALFGTTLTISSLEDGRFPILTTRKMYPEGVWGELAAFIRAAESLADFQHWGCNYWDANAAAWAGNRTRPPALWQVGKIYGGQWRDFNKVDQLRNLVEGIKSDPLSRRHLLTTYNPAEVHLGCLPPCHLTAQFNVTNHGWLECIVYMRSVDLILGLPSDIVLYATLLALVARETNYDPGYLTFMMGDTHVYSNHKVGWQLQRAHTPQELPEYKLDHDTTLFHFVPDQISLVDYVNQGRIAYEFNA